MIIAIIPYLVPQHCSLVQPVLSALYFSVVKLPPSSSTHQSQTGNLFIKPSIARRLPKHAV